MVNNTSWVVNDNYYTYVKLKHGSNVEHVIQKLNAYLQRHAGAELKSHSDHITNSLQALKDIHLNSSEFVDYLAYQAGQYQIPVPFIFCGLDHIAAGLYQLYESDNSTGNKPCP